MSESTQGCHAAEQGNVSVAPDVDEGKSALSRRSFLKGAGLAVLGATAAAGVAGCSSVSEAKAVGMPEKWDAEADIIVVGYGAGGVVSAITASDMGASVIVLEKSPAAEGGNLGCSTGSIHTQLRAEDMDDFYAKMKHGCFGTTEEQVLKTLADNMQDTPQWFEEHDIPLAWTKAEASAQRPAGYTGSLDLGGGKTGAGWELFAALDKVAVERGADIRFSAPAISLVQDPETKEIRGVVAQVEGGQQFFKAKKGVIMACGGYENNPQKQGWYNQPGVRMWPWGTIYNTGDGIDMCSAVGCAMWHLHGLEWAAVNFRLPSEEAGCSVSTDATTGINPPNYIFVNKNGQRFMNEAKGMGHDIEQKPVLAFDAKTETYKNLPFFMVFDSNLFNEGPLWTGTGRVNIVNTYAGVFKLCDWGSDNTKPLEKGWMFKGDTLEELAGKITGLDPSEESCSVDATGLATAVEHWNAMCETGEDADFGRDPKKSAPLQDGPFYAIEMGLSTINTQGGPRRNEFNQSLDAAGDPVPRLYSVGEFGSVNGYVYIAGNIAEAFTNGRVATTHAAGLDAWDAK